jgi:glycosyltransferase involved in cell wall biosynthesis
MSELLIDATRLVGRLMKGRLPTGIDRVCLAYIRQYGPSAQAILQKGRFGMVLSKPASRDLFSLLLEPESHFTRRAVRIIAGSLFPAFPERHGTAAVVLNLGHSGPEQRGYSDWLQRRRLRCIFMVHDLIPVTHPEYCRTGEDARHSRRMLTILRTAAGVMTNSRATLDALAVFAAGRGLAMPPARVARLAAAAFPEDCGRRPEPAPYFVMLSTIEPRKNHGLILNVWRRLIEKYGEAAPRLVVIGQRGWKCDNVMDLLERSDALRGIVVHRSGCSDAELGNYLQHAQALLFPSFVEGYGLPLIEALSLGVPAIASDLAVFRETTGDIPI